MAGETPVPPNQHYALDVKTSSVIVYITGPFTSPATDSSGHVTYYPILDPSAIEWEIGYGLDPAIPQLSQAYTGNGASYGTLIDHLIPGVMYYFWARGRNSYGWGQYSTVFSAKTIAGVHVNVNGVWKDAVAYMNVGGVWVPMEPWARIAGIWKRST